MPIRFCLLFLSIAATTDADTILLNDGTRAAISIVDTDGCCIVVRRGNDCVKIDKKKVTRCVAATDSSRAGNQNTKDALHKTPLSINRATANILAGYTVKKTALQCGVGIGFLALTIVGNVGDEKMSAEFSKTMTGFLAKNGTLRTLSKEGLYLYLTGEAVNARDCRYCALPYEISVKSIERKTNVSSFVKLDTAGNFVPTTKGITLKALERETRVRFMVADLLKKNIVFDERVIDIDKGLKEIETKNVNDSQNHAGKNSILRIEGKMEALLKKQFK